ncbi:hypothetical protein [Actinomadura rubrisoli]|uniref:Uncharacterized protein n=1 Tax=Actinomadura rubrisoli TaxID=2530368 RepID=A0A4R4ZZZ8_9ACTN|nr:hypothetical protein [Actinomadura rubrisoli]TDD63759.1 hypothetical protein E1298_43195 [Actinomadura rubrisoli]
MGRGEAGRGRGGALLWGVIAEICVGGSLFILLMSPTARRDAFFGPDGSVAVLVTALCVTAIEIVAALLLRRARQGIRWGVTLPGVLCAGVVGAMSLGNLTSGLVFLLLPAAVGMHLVSIYVARQRSPAIRA